MSPRDFLCGRCGSHQFWIKQWTDQDPDWYVLCHDCHELYWLRPDGMAEVISYKEQVLQ